MRRKWLRWLGLFSDVSRWKSHFTGYILCLTCSVGLSNHTYSHTNYLLIINVHTPSQTQCPIDLIHQWCWHEQKQTTWLPLFIHYHLIQLFMIKDFYIVSAQLWLLIVVFVKMNLPFVINEPETWGITSVLSECHRQNQARTAKENICHWTEGFCPPAAWSITAPSRNWLAC